MDIQKINKHPLKNEIKRKLEKKEIVIGTPINFEFKWTHEKEKDLLLAIEKVNKLRS